MTSSPSASSPPAKAVGEPVWRLPLAESYDRAIDSDAADVKNIAGDRAAGSIIGAQFVQRFVNNVPLGASRHRRRCHGRKRTRRPCRRAPPRLAFALLDRFVADYYESD